MTPHFKLIEFTRSATADARKIDNKPTQAHLKNLHVLAGTLEQVRSLLGGAIIISSGYRNPELNKAVGGSPTSAHAMGLAIDFTCPSFGTPTDVVKAIEGSNINYDQLILEFDGGKNWVHFGLHTNKWRRQTLVYRNGKYSPFKNNE